MLKESFMCNTIQNWAQNIWKNIVHSAIRDHWKLRELSALKKSMRVIMMSTISVSLAAAELCSATSATEE